MTDRGSSLLLAIGAVALTGALVSGAAITVTSTIRTDAALREGRDRRLAVEGVLRQAAAAVEQSTAPCRVGPFVGVLNDVVVLVERRESCRLIADVAGLRLRRHLVLRACPSNIESVASDVVSTATQLVDGPWQLDELSSAITVSGCTGVPVIEAGIDLERDTPTGAVLRSWTEVQP